MAERPKVVTDDHLKYLDNLRESGVTNMWGAGTFILKEFPALTEPESRAVCSYWMKTFGETSR